jgi:hypothetical protein
LRDVEKEIHWAKTLVKRSEELGDWESQLRYIEKLTEIYCREGKGDDERGCLLKVEELLQKRPALPGAAENAAHYEKLIEIYGTDLSHNF